jgi:hypothetical protein
MLKRFVEKTSFVHVQGMARYRPHPVIPFDLRGGEEKE